MSWFGKKRHPLDEPPNIEVVTGQHFKGQAVQLDGVKYLNCIFENCTMTWDGGYYSVEGCRVAGTRGFAFGAQNRHAIATFNLLHMWGALDKAFMDSWGTPDPILDPEGAKAYAEANARKSGNGESPSRARRGKAIGSRKVRAKQARSLPT